MKKLVLSLTIVAAMSLGGCMNLKIAAPEGKVVQLGNKSKSSPIKASSQKDVYYVLWGLVPITNNSTEDLLADVSEDTKVVIETKFTVKNFIINIFGSLLTITSQNVAVEEQK